MSVVVAIKYNNGVVVAADKRLTGYNDVSDNSVKINKYKYSKTVVGAVGRRRNNNIILTMDEIINYKDILDNTQIDLNYVIKNVVKTIFDELRKNNRVESINGIEEISSSFMFCTKDKIFTIVHDGCVCELPQFAALGCGDEYSTGYLNTLNLENITKKQATEYVKNAIVKSCESSPYISSDIDILYVEDEIKLTCDTCTNEDNK